MLMAVTLTSAIQTDLVLLVFVPMRIAVKELVQQDHQDQQDQQGVASP